MGKLLIDEQPMVVLPSLATAVGLNESVFLQQLHYWIQKSGHEKDGRMWIYNTYEDWQKQFPFWSTKTIRRIVTTLRNRGLIETTSQYNSIPTDRTLWYSIAQDEVDKLVVPCGQIDHMDVDKLTAPCGQNDRMYNIETETTTETTKPEKGEKKMSATPTSGTTAIMAAYVSVLGYKPTAYGMESKAAKEIAARGYAPEDVVSAYGILKRQDFWQSKHVSLQIVLRELPALANYAKNGGNVNAIGKRMNQAEKTQQAFDNVRARLNGKVIYDG